LEKKLRFSLKEVKVWTVKLSSTFYINEEKKDGKLWQKYSMDQFKEKLNIKEDRKNDAFKKKFKKPTAFFP